MAGRVETLANLVFYRLLAYGAAGTLGDQLFQVEEINCFKLFCWEEENINVTVSV